MTTLLFGYADYKGDLNWQKEQITELRELNENYNNFK